MGDNIKVVVKVRPLINREIEDKLPLHWVVKNNTLYQVDNTGKFIGSSYTFDKVYPEESITSEIYEDVAKPIVDACIAGINGTIFAYGQTSSGKTYTMMGTEECPGIVPKAVINIFDKIKGIPDRDFLVRVSYLEIYNEKILDLLNIDEKNAKILDADGFVKVCVTEKVASSPDEVLQIMNEGEVNRQVASTNMNEQSSRSHTIFQITVESREHSEDGEDVGCVNVSQLNLVDLAGSERAGQTGATGLRFKEGTHINKSLSSLGLVIKTLSEDPRRFVNYRDSKLTRILQNSLGGNAKTSIICAVTPAAAEETISTLQFANRAKAIQNKPEVNAVATNATMIQSLTKKLAKLQYELENKKSVEQDNQILQSKIRTMQRQILNGFGARRDTTSDNRRRTWCAPRRATISALPPIQEDDFVSAPRFDTPLVKYNPMLAPPQFSELSRRRPSDIVEADENCSMNTTGRSTIVAQNRLSRETTEVIHLDDSDEERAEGVCSPYHRCYSASATPPCVLRDKYKNAEKNLKDIIELTEREKLYPPSIAELMGKLEQNTIVIETLKDEVESSRKQLDLMTNENNKLSDDLRLAQTEIQSLHSSKADLENMCQEYKVTITDLEVSLERLKIKSKKREQELLSRIEEITPKTSQIFPCTVPSKNRDDLEGFLNLSRDISLVASDIDTSLPKLDNTCPDKNSEQLIDYKNQIANLELLIRNFTSDNEKLNEEKKSLTSKINNLKASLDSADNDIRIYNEIIKVFLHQSIKENLENYVVDNQYSISFEKPNNFELKKILNHLGVRNSVELRETYKELQSHQGLNMDLRHEIAALKASLKEKETHLKTMPHNIEVDSSECQKLTEYNQIYSKVHVEELQISLQNLRIENSVLKETIEKLESDLKKERMNLENMTKEYHEKISAVKNSQCELISNLSQKDEEISSLFAEKVNIMSELNSIKRDLSIKEGNFFVIAKKLEKMRDCIEEPHHKINQTENMVFEELDSATSMLLDIVNDIDVKTTNTAKNYIDFKERVEHLEICCKQASEELRETVNIVEEKNKEIQILKTSLKEVSEKLSEAKQLIESKVLENDTLYTDIASLKANIDELVKDNNLKENELITLRNDLKDLMVQINEEKTDLEKKYNDINNLSKCKDEQIEKLSQDVARLEYSLEKNSDIQLQSTDFINKLRHKDDEIANHKMVLNTIRISIDNILMSTTHEENFVECCNFEELVVDDVIILIEKLRQHVADMDHRICEYKTLNKDLTLQLTESKEGKLNIQSDSVQKIYDLESELHQKEQLVHSKLKELSELQSKYKDLNSNYLEANDLVNSMRDKITSLENTWSIQERERSLLEASCEIHSKELNRLRISFEDSEKNKEQPVHDFPVLAHQRLHPETDNNKKNHPLSLKELTRAKINEYSDITYSILSETCDQDTNSKMVCDPHRELEKLNKVIEMLQHTITEQEIQKQKLTEEVCALLQPLGKLNKRISKHKTNLLTVTATNYAENKLLRTKVKSLQYHHNRLHNICQRDIPEMNKQLKLLYSILHSDLDCSAPTFELNEDYADNQFESYSENKSFIKKSFLDLSCMASLDYINDQNLGTEVKDESISFDDTLRHIDESRIPASYDFSCQTDFGVEDNLEGEINTLDVETRLLILDELKLLLSKEKESYSIETKSIEKYMKNLILDMSKLAKTSHTTAVSNSLVSNSPEEYLTQENGEFDEIVAQNESLSQMSSLVNLIETLKSESVSKSKEIAMLTDKVNTYSHQISQLQTENDTLSNEIMDRLTELDNLKEELDKINNGHVVLTHPGCQNHSSSMLTLNKSACDKIQNLNIEVTASKEECSKLTVELAAMKSQLDQNTPNSQNQTNTDCLYQHDKDICLQFFMEKTGIHDVRIDNFTNLIDLMKCLYENLVNKHNTEVDNLQNQLKGQLEAKNSVERSLAMIEGELSNTHSNIKKYKEELEKIQDNIYKNAVKIGSTVDFRKKIEITTDDTVAETVTKCFDAFYYELQSKDDINLNLKNQLAVLDDDINSKKVDLLNINNELQTMASKYQELTIEYENERKLHEALTKKLQDREEALDIITKKIHQNLVEYKIIESQDIDIHSSNEILIEKLFASWAQKRDETIARFTCLETERNNEIQDLRDKIQTNENAIASKAAENDQLQREVTNLKEICRAVTLDLVKTQERREVEQTVEIQNEHEKDQQKLSSKISQLTVEMIFLRNENSGYKNKISELEQLVESLKTERQENNPISTQIDENFALLQDMKIKTDLLTKANKELTTERENLSIELKKTKILVRELQLSLKKLEENVKETEHNLINANSELSEIKETNNNLLLALDKLQQKYDSTNSKLSDTEIELRNKMKECTQLEENVKTHQKTACFQHTLHKRLQKEKEDLEAQILKKEEIIHEKQSEVDKLVRNCEMIEEQYKVKCSEKELMQEEIHLLRSQLENLKQEQRENSRGRNSLSSMADGKRRRQSLHDNNRPFGADKLIGDSEDVSIPDSIFKPVTNLEELFTKSERRSADNSLRTDITNKNDDSMDSSTRDSLLASRRRRQSLHDQHRPSYMEMENKENDDAQKLARENRSLKLEVERLKKSAAMNGDDHSAREVEILKSELETLRAQHEQLQHEYKEMDEEYETCAEYLHEKEERVYELNQIIKELQAKISELESRVEGVRSPSDEVRRRRRNSHDLNRPRLGADAATETDEGWLKQHPWLASRVDYTHELQKNKKLKKAVDALKTENGKLKQDMAKLLDDMKANSNSAAGDFGNSALQKHHTELEQCKQRYAEILQKYQDLEASYLRAKEATKVSPGNELSPVVISIKKKRQSLHDQNRDAAMTMVDAAINTDPGALTVLGVDELTHERERDRVRRLTASNAQLKDRIQEMSTQLRRLQQMSSEDTAQLVAPSQADALRVKAEQYKKEVIACKDQIANLSQQVATLKEQLDKPAKTATNSCAGVGSAIVQSVQISDLLKENEDLKKANLLIQKHYKKKLKDCSCLHQENKNPGDV